MQEMTIKDILKALQKRWWMIVVFCVLVTAAVGIYFNSKPDEYTSQAMLHVLQDYKVGDEIRYDITASTQLAADFKILMHAPDIMSQTITKLGIDQEAFDDISIDISTDPGSRILRITASGYDPYLCQQVAKTVSEVFTEYTRDNISGNAVKIVSVATYPDTASGPLRGKNTLLAAAVSLMLAVGAVLAVEMLNTTLYSSSLVESELGHPVLAGIQNYKKEIKQFMQNRKPGEMLSKGVSTLTKENVRTLAANVQFATLEQPVQTMIVTSSIAGEGKSSLLLMMAEAFADLGKRVLVVDLDMRNPSIGQYLGERGRYDLFDYLVGRSRLEEVICKTGHHDIHFIDSRHRLASVSQIVNFEVFERFLDAVKRAYDLVLFDTPPLGLFVDAAALANKMDGAVFVVGSGMADRAVSRDSVEQLHKANANVLGVALNYVNYPKAFKHYYGKKKGYGSGKKEPPATFKEIVQQL